MGETSGLTIWALGAHHFLEVTAQDRDAIVSVMSDLKQLVAFEQKFDLLLENLMEFERELLDRSLALNMRGLQSAHDLQDDQLAFARRLLNVMSAARTYVDHVKHHMSAMHPSDAAVSERVGALFSERYDASLDYRTMEALRNYSQHRGMPVHGFVYEPRWIDGEGERDSRRLEANVRITLNPEVLREDGGFKAAVLEELEASDKEPDLKAMVRRYVEDLGAVHLALRAMVKERSDAAKKALTEWRTLYSEASGADSIVGLALVDRTDQDQTSHITGMSETPLVYLDRLLRRNGALANLSARSVSSRVLPPKPRLVGAVGS